MGSGNVEDNLTERRKFSSISDLEAFVAMEGKESDILEWKDYNKTKLDDKKEDILKAVCGLANNKGGYFVIGFDDDGKTVYSKIDFDEFAEKLNNWANDLVEPRGIRNIPDRITNDSGQCIIVYVDISPGTCYSIRFKDAYKFPYRTHGSTRYYNPEDFFKIYFHKFLKDVAVSGELMKREEEPPLISFVTDKSAEEPFDSELVSNYVDILSTTNPSSRNEDFLFQKIRSETYKVYHQGKIDEESLPAVENLIEFAYELIKARGDEVMESVLDALYPFTRAPETLELMKDKCYEYFKELFEKGDRRKDLVKILDTCGYFGDRMDEILKAIENKEKDVLDVLTSGLNLEETKDRKYELIKQLVVKTNDLDPDDDRVIIDKVHNTIRKIQET